MALPFLLGCQWRGVRHVEEETVDEQFRMVRDAGVFDHYDRLPPAALLDEHIKASQKYGVPVHTGTSTYQLGRDDAQLLADLDICREMGIRMLNMMLLARHADGHVLDNGEIADCYLRTSEQAARRGVRIAFEVHVNCWSEDFTRVKPLCERVRSYGVPFNFTLDYSHCVFKMENPGEQDLSGIREAVERGEIVLDPFEEGNYCDQWLAMNMVSYAQFRPAVPNGPKNIWAADAQGQPGRGIQYPFMRPTPGQWHSPWHAWRLEPIKESIRKIFRYHLAHPDSPLEFMNTEMLATLDYGMNAKYSLFEHNTACAVWLRKTWDTLAAQAAAGV